MSFSKMCFNWGYSDGYNGAQYMGDGARSIDEETRMMFQEDYRQGYNAGRDVRLTEDNAESLMLTGLSDKDIAEMMHITVDQVQDLLFAARERTVEN